MQPRFKLFNEYTHVSTPKPGFILKAWLLVVKLALKQWQYKVLLLNFFPRLVLPPRFNSQVLGGYVSARNCQCTWTILPHSETSERHSVQEKHTQIDKALPWFVPAKFSSQERLLHLLRFRLPGSESDLGQPARGCRQQQVSTVHPRNDPEAVQSRPVRLGDNWGSAGAHSDGLVLHRVSFFLKHRQTDATRAHRINACLDERWIWAGILLAGLQNARSVSCRHKEVTYLC